MTTHFRARIGLVIGFVLAGGAVALVACSSSSTPATASGSDAGDVSDTSTTPADASSGDTEFIGVYLNQLENGWGIVSNTYKGQPGDRCYPKDVGSGCYVIDCTDTTKPLVLDNAGAITITNASGDAIVLPAQTSGGYPFHSQPNGVEYAPGSTVMLSAAGSTDVPAYTQTITMPGNITRTSPALADGGFDDAGSAIDGGSTVDISRSQDLVVTWSGSQPKIDIELSKYNPKNAINGSASLICIVDGTTGTFTIPSAALMGLPASDGTTLDSLILGGDANAKTTSGNATVLFDGRNFGGTPVSIHLQ